MCIFQNLPLMNTGKGNLELGGSLPLVIVGGILGTSHKEVF